MNCILDLKLLIYVLTFTFVSVL